MEFKNNQIIGKGGSATITKFFDKKRRIWIARKWLNFDEAYYWNFDRDGLPIELDEGEQSFQKTLIDSFKREVRILSDLNHPNIVRVLDQNSLNYPFWFDMPRYQTNLSEYTLLNKDEKDFIGLITKLLKAIEYLHLKGILHRDFSPKNILYRGLGDIAICDFCFSKRFNQSISQRLINENKKKRSFFFTFQREFETIATCLFKIISNKYLGNCPPRILEKLDLTTYSINRILKVENLNQNSPIKTLIEIWEG